MLSLLASSLALLLRSAVLASSCDIETDVLVVGGGATGTYAAVKIHDLGKDVLLVEKTGVLGGHVNTYTDPATGNVINVGVQSFHNTSTVRDYFARLNVSFLPPGGDSAAPSTQIFADFQLGQIANYTEPSQATQAEALQNYLNFLKANASTLDLGYDHLPFPVPEDLLLPFGELAKKYNFEAAVHLINSFNQPRLRHHPRHLCMLSRCLGSILPRPSSAATSSRRTTSRTSTVRQPRCWARACSSTRNSSRSSDRPRASPPSSRRPRGKKRVRAKKILNTAYPLLSNLKGWDLSAQERKLFEQFDAHSYFASVLRTEGAGRTTVVANIGSKDPFGNPSMPGAFGISTTQFPGTHVLYYGANSIISERGGAVQCKGGFRSA